MAQTSVADATGLAATYADRWLVGTTRDVHRAILGRLLGATRQRHTPVGHVYDGLTATVYGCVGLATRSVRHVGRLGILGGDLEASRNGRRVRSVVNGLIGDVLADQSSPVAITPSVRVDGRDVELTPEALTEALPATGRRVAIFVHGLCEDDEVWSYRVDTRGPSYLDRLADESDWTAVAVRFNSGLPIRTSAAALARLVDKLVDSWPVEVGEIALVGHSMGGLVVRAAADHAAGAWWSDRVRHVVLLGSPHSGAGLERAVSAAIPLVSRLAEVAPLGTLLDERSTGIRDLYDGIGPDRGGWPRASYQCVAATLGASERHLAGRIFGDLLVRLDSARGRGAGLEAEFFQLTGAHHFDLLNHPDVYRELSATLQAATPETC